MKLRTGNDILIEMIFLALWGLTEMICLKYK